MFDHHFPDMVKLSFLDFQQNFSLLDTDEKMSKMSWVTIDKGTLILSNGKLALIVPVFILCALPNPLVRLF